MSNEATNPASCQTAVVCSCGIEFVQQDYYINGKCFLCEETPEQKKKTEWFNKLLDSEKENYVRQQKEDLDDFNMVRLSH